MMKLKTSLTTPQLLEVLIHIVIWVLIFGFPLLFIEHDNIPNVWAFYLRHFRQPLAFAMVFYVNYALLVPRFLFKKQGKKYYIYNLILIVSTSLTLHLSSEWMHFNPNRDEMPPAQTIQPQHPQTADNNGQEKRPPADRHQAPQHPRRHFPPRWIFLMRDTILLCFIAGLAVAIRKSREWRSIEEAQRNAELNNLRNQLNPHFLLNTLNNIYALTAFDTEKAQQAIQELSRLLRHLLYDNKQNFVPLKQEADFIHNYVELMRIRLSKEVKVEVNIDIRPDSPTLIAPLIFISLIENAFKHGISTTGSSFISILLKEENDHDVRCTIINSNYPKNSSDKSGSGIGLQQVSRRLELIYPNRHEWKKGVSEDEKTYYSSILIHAGK